MFSEPSPKQSRRKSEYERPIVYDREIFIEICRRLLLGEDPLAICEKPPMPTRPGFLGWTQDHKEAREIYRSMENFRSDRALASKLGTPSAGRHRRMGGAGSCQYPARLASGLHRPQRCPNGNGARSGPRV